jgi:hypothetical protein
MYSLPLERLSLVRVVPASFCHGVSANPCLRLSIVSSSRIPLLPRLLSLSSTPVAVSSAEKHVSRQNDFAEERRQAIFLKLASSWISRIWPDLRVTCPSMWCLCQSRIVKKPSLSDPGFETTFIHFAPLLTGYCSAVAAFDLLTSLLYSLLKFLSCIREIVFLTFGFC